MIPATERRSSLAWVARAGASPPGVMLCEPNNQIPFRKETPNAQRGGACETARIGQETEQRIWSSGVARQLNDCLSKL